MNDQVVLSTVNISADPQTLISSGGPRDRIRIRSIHVTIKATITVAKFVVLADGVALVSLPIGLAIGKYEFRFQSDLGVIAKVPISTTGGNAQVDTVMIEYSAY